MNQRIILGMGAGQCGLNLLREILGQQPSTQITLEQTPLLPWIHRSDEPGIRERIARWKTTRKEGFVGDVAAFYLPYIEEAVGFEPGIRVICLKRSQEEFISAFSCFLNQNYPFPINHWTKTPPTGWFHDPLWTQTFPQYDIEDRIEGLTRYWSEYYERAGELEHTYPGNVLNLDVETLLSQEGVRRILDFIGFNQDQQVIVTGQKPPPPPPIEDIGIPPRRYQEPLDPRKCVILVPFISCIHQECESALKELERRGYEVRRVAGFAAIDQARNQLATDALIDNFEETLWIDSDIAFHPNDVEKLRRHQLPVVCGIYPQKGKRSFACEFPNGIEKVKFGNEGGLLEILYAGTGFLLIRREVYSAIQRNLNLPVCNERFGRPMIPFFKPMVLADDDGHWYLAEDFSFCERARQSEFEIYADTSIRLWHMGTYSYGWEDAGISQARFESFTLNASTKITD